MKTLISIKEIDSIFEYGSKIYKTNNINSDNDYIIVIKDIDSNDFQIKYEKQLNLENTDFKIIQKKDFIEEIRSHEISTLECLWLDKNHILKNSTNYIDFFQLDLNKLRHSISQKSSNSFVKCKKKFLIEEDYAPYIGKKSMFHSIRMLDFGIQIAKFSKIVNYESQNDKLEILKNLNSWEEINNIFKPIYNKISSDFKLLAPKEEIIKKLKI